VIDIVLAVMDVFVMMVLMMTFVLLWSFVEMNIIGIGIVILDTKGIGVGKIIVFFTEEVGHLSVVNKLTIGLSLKKELFRLIIVFRVDKIDGLLL
jgi:hypothetical protein